MTKAGVFVPVAWGDRLALLLPVFSSQDNRFCAARVDGFAPDRSSGEGDPKGRDIARGCWNPTRGLRAGVAGCKAIARRSDGLVYGLISSSRSRSSRAMTGGDRRRDEPLGMGILGCSGGRWMSEVARDSVRGIFGWQAYKLWHQGGDRGERESKRLESKSRRSIASRASFLKPGIWISKVALQPPTLRQFDLKGRGCRSQPSCGVPEICGRCEATRAIASFERRSRP